MAEIRFAENDGLIRLQLESYNVMLQGNGIASYASRFPMRNVKLAASQRPELLRLLDRAARVATVFSAAAAAAFIIWQWYVGANTPPAVELAANIASFALLGSLLSFGGLNLLSLQTELGESRNRIETVEHRCPFLSIVSGEDRLLYRPGNPNFCQKCPLGVDRISDEDAGFLMHNCNVYQGLHQEWRLLPGAEQYLRENNYLR